jgi:hypothetical protein
VNVYYNCKKPDDDHGNPANIKNKTFREAAKARNKDDVEKAKQNTAELLNEQQEAGRTNS